MGKKRLTNNGRTTTMTKPLQQKSIARVQNLFCSASDLSNEASVEAWFVNKLIDYLSYLHEDVKLKTSLREFKVGKGSKSELYKPDYVIQINKLPVLVIDAKSTTENIDDWTPQCSSYCLELNKEYPQKPVEYFLLSNGLKTSLYKWDERKSKVDLDFEDFKAGNAKFNKLVDLVSKAKLLQLSEKKYTALMETDFEFETASVSEISELFGRIHNFIWRTDKKDPSAAFQELMKIVFIKLKKDRELHEKFGNNFKPKVQDIVFSVAWIKNQTEHDNPINDPLFKNLVKELEKEINAKHKKRIFDAGEEIELSPSTIEKIVTDLEHIDLSAMDDGDTDVHGRMFETFLNATVRGKDLGQYFTPRDIVELMVNLAGIRVEKEKEEYKIDKVLDACCGSGGFLICSMILMLAKAKKLIGLTEEQHSDVRKRIVDHSIVGIDAGSNPPIYRIARMNMYLHGDGGSRIFFADSLDKRIGKVGKSTIESDEQIQELRNMILKDKEKFEVILSNPPFSLTYSRKQKEQKEIMEQYELATYKKISKSLLSSLMFLERYKDLVADKGQILAIIDESVLSGEKYSNVRDYIRKTFIIKAIISLPGDAFKRQGSRVKTSILILRTKKNEEKQPELFMETSVYLGLTEKIARRIGIERDELVNGKIEETIRILEGYQNFEKGQRSNAVVEATTISDRLDVKYCLSEKERLRREELWLSKGAVVTSLSDVLTPAKNRIVKVDEDEVYTMLKVTYDGEVLEAETKDGQEISYSRLYRVHEWDILISGMGMGRGAIGIVPKYHDGKFVSNEYTVLAASSEEEALFYVNLLRTKEIMGAILSSTTGMNRGRIKWKTLSTLEVPKYEKTHDDMSEAVKALNELWSSYVKYFDEKGKAIGTVVSKLQLEDKQARKRWLAYKPPE